MADLRHRRLLSQRLAGARLESAAETVGWFGAVQAQDYPAAKWALGQRLTGTTDTSLDAAFNAGAILRTHVMRPTWHFVRPADARWLQDLTAPRLRASLAGRLRQLDLDPSTVARATDVIGQSLAGGRHLTRADLGDVLKAHGISVAGQRLPHLLMAAEIACVAISGPLRGRQHTYAYFPERAPEARSIDRDQALAELALRYFMSHGPAQIVDFTWWSALTVADAKRGIEAAGSALGSEEIAGRRYWFDASAGSQVRDGMPAHLLPNYDEFTVAYRHRNALFESGPALDPFQVLANVVTVAGEICGHWKRTLTANRVAVNITLLRPLNRDEAAAAEAAAAAYGRFLERPASITGL